VFVQQKVRRTLAIQLDAASVVPLDNSLKLLAICQDDDHRRLALHLFGKIKLFRIRLFGRSGLFSGWPLRILFAFHGSDPVLVKWKIGAGHDALLEGSKMKHFGVRRLLPAPGYVNQ
jgi:hypothetical protein